MKGRNVLRLNEATMQEALQCYLDKIMMHAPRVDGVKQVESHPSPVFEVELLTPATDEEKFAALEGAKL